MFYCTHGANTNVSNSTYDQIAGNQVKLRNALKTLTSAVAVVADDIDSSTRFCARGDDDDDMNNTL